MFEPKGYVIVDKELKHTKEPGIGPNGKDLTKPYFDALKAKMVPVMDIAVDGSDYLVLGQSSEIGGFLWMVDKKDTIGEMIPYSVLHPFNIKTMVALVDKVVNKKALSEDDISHFSKMMAATLAGVSIGGLMRSTDTKKGGKL